MISYNTMAHRGIETTTLGELLAGGGLERFPDHATVSNRQCSDADPRNALAPGGYAMCLRCELIVCRDPREQSRRESTVEIETQAQVWIDSMIQTSTAP